MEDEELELNDWSLQRLLVEELYLREVIGRVRYWSYFCDDVETDEQSQVLATMVFYEAYENNQEVKL